MKVIKYKEGMTITPPMFISGMPNDVYHATAEGISNSGLKLVAISPAHYQYQEPRSATRAMEIGTAIHTALLEPERLSSEYVMLRDVKDRRASEYKEAVKTHGSELVLVSSEADRVAGMQETVFANPLMSSRLNAPGWRELSLFVNDPETGVMIRVRYDLLTERAQAVDVKKTQDARPEAFSRTIDNYGYDMQAALYLDAYEWATGDTATFEFAAVEEKMPHGLKLYTPDQTMLDEGRRKYREALLTFAACQKTGEWPNLLCEEVEIIELPPYRMAQIDNEEIEGIY